MKALGKYILISPIQAKEDTTSMSGFITSSIDNSKLRYQEATVVLPGTDVDCVKKGDEIAYDNAEGHTIKIDGEFFTLISERAIALILN